MFKRKRQINQEIFNQHQTNTNEHDELDEILKYIEEHEEELIAAEKHRRKHLPYWICTF